MVSLERSKTRAKGHWAEILRRNKTRNNIIGALEAGPDFVHKLYESPEFLRYQVGNEQT